MITAEQIVRGRYPDAELYGYGHGKVRIESPTAGVLGDMKYLGTRERRRDDAWDSAAGNIQRVTRPYPRTAPCAVLCRGDGNQISAIIDVDRWPHQGGVAGFGDDLPSALRNLADELEREVGQVPA